MVGWRNLIVLKYRSGTLDYERSSLRSVSYTHLFEIKMTYNELTSDYVLEITDFAEPDEVADMKELWESQVAKLRRTCGF